MATRCSIKIEGVDYAKVYKHRDGYPEATLERLEKFNKKFTENRGVDNTYKFAQLLRSSIRDSEEFGLDDNLYTGRGVYGMKNDLGEEYEYILNEDGSVTVNEL